VNGVRRAPAYDNGGNAPASVAPDGHRGLHLGLTRAYQVMILDRRLPSVDGLDLLGRLRRSGVTCPVLVLSALGNPADRVEGLGAGAEDYLAKPFDLDELLARLRALRRRHLDQARIVPIGLRRTGSAQEGPSSGLVGGRDGAGVLTALAIVVAMATLVQIYRIGDSGAKAVWHDTPAATTGER